MAWGPCSKALQSAATSKIGKHNSDRAVVLLDLLDIH